MNSLALVLVAICPLATATTAPDTATVKGCLYQGMEYSPGEIYKDDCNTCHCLGNNVAACTLMACHVSGNTRIAPDTDSPEGCLYQGVEYRPGETYMNDCNTCHCVGKNVAACTLMACVHTRASTKGCLFQGVEYKAGETYMNDCNTCHCAGNNLATCTLMACPHDNGDRIAPDTDSPEGCLYQGVEYRPGETYMNDCNTCHCVGKNVAACTLMACVHTRASTKGCLFQGVEYKAGETYMNDCNTCHCAGNNLATCTLMACP
ncbi:uncharacterized protein LOC143281858 [Babylonia areolata]|uniref:uncharacterized protein LOC143281858 n=1 Tax=Babylonia areolata TaxID=304850 RepID=UPI003FD619E0